MKLTQLSLVPAVIIEATPNPCWWFSKGEYLDQNSKIEKCKLTIDFSSHSVTVACRDPEIVRDELRSASWTVLALDRRNVWLHLATLVSEISQVLPFPHFGLDRNGEKRQKVPNSPGFIQFIPVAVPSFGYHRAHLRWQQLISTHTLELGFSQARIVLRGQFLELLFQRIATEPDLEIPQRVCRHSLDRWIVERIERHAYGARSAPRFVA